MRASSSTRASPSSGSTRATRAAAGDVLGDAQVVGGEGRDHGQVGDADDLAVPGQPPETLADRLGDRAADAGIYFVENQKVNAVLGFQRALQGQHDARQLAARGDLAAAGAAARRDWR